MTDWSSITEEQYELLEKKLKGLLPNEEAMIIGRQPGTTTKIRFVAALRSNMRLLGQGMNWGVKAI